MLRAPFPALKKPPRNPLKEGFLDELSKVCQENETVPPEKIPYRKAVLRHHNYDLSKRWYVEYYAWHEEKEKLVRCRLFDPLNRMKGMNQRITTGEELVRIINGKLYAGQFIRATGPMNPVRPQLRTATVKQAIEIFIQKKKDEGCRENYLKRYRTLINNWEEWRTHSKTNDFHFQYLNEQNIAQFFQYLFTVKEVSARSFNNYRGDMEVFLNYVTKNYPRVIKANLLQQVSAKRMTRSTRHAAFTDEQIQAINQACHQMKFNHLLLMIHMIYYTLARPSELRQLKIQNLDIKQNRIFIPGTISKNWNDEYVYMPPALRKELERQNIFSYPKHFFLFGHGEEPAERPIYPTYFWKRNRRIIKRLKLTERRYDLYSYKHSGAISLYRATKDIKLVQHACRHSDINQTANYLRELGIVDHDYFKLDQWKGAL